MQNPSRFLSACLLGWALMGPAYARLPVSSNAAFPKFVGSSVVVIVESLGKSADKPASTFALNVELVKVLQKLKGDDVSDELLFITQGIASEMNADCCVAGERYLLFLNRGYPVMDQEGDLLVAHTQEAARFVSGADGRASAYRLCGDRVMGWPNPSDGGKLLTQVIRELHQRKKQP